MGSPGPRAFGSDAIEPPRCGASPRATRPDRAYPCGRSRFCWWTTGKVDRSLRRPRSTSRPARSTVTASLRLGVGLCSRVGRCRKTAISCRDGGADRLTVGEDDHASWLVDIRNDSGLDKKDTFTNGIRPGRRSLGKVIRSHLKLNPAPLPAKVWTTDMSISAGFGGRERCLPSFALTANEVDNWLRLRTIEL